MIKNELYNMISEFIFKCQNEKKTIFDWVKQFSQDLIENRISL